MFLRCLYLSILLLAAFHAHAQLYNFKHYTANEGLPEYAINTICEDQRGNLWIGTSGGGVLRFDGYSFYTYLEEDGLINNAVNTIIEDDKGKVWIGTEKGVCTYDGIRFSNFKNLENQPVNIILQDAAKNVWFGTNKSGLYKFDGHSLTQFTTRKGLIDNTINCLYQDKNSNLWIGTTKGLGKYGSKTSKSYTTTDGLASNNIQDICEDASGNLWLVTDNGASQFDGTNFTNYVKRDGLASNDIHSVLHDGKGTVWFGTSGGITKYNGVTFESNNADTRQGNNTITCVYKDSESNLWFGSSERGLSKLDSERFIHYPENDQLGKRVYSVIQAINGNMLCGTSLGGATVFDGKQYALLDGVEGLSSSIIQSFYYSADSTLWLGTTDEGVYKFNKSGFVKYTDDDGLVSNDITGFATDPAGHLWIASAANGVSVINSASDSLVIIKNYTTLSGLISNKITALVSDNLNNTIWLGTQDKGINKIIFQSDPVLEPDITHLSASNALSSDNIYSLLPDSLGNMFIGTSQGINIYNGERFYTISKSDGLVSNNIYSLTLDNNHDLWIGTERGINRISLDANFKPVIIRRYGPEEGFKGIEVYKNSSCKDKQGNIWFGTVNGLAKYNHKGDLDIGFTPKIHITGVKLFFDKIENTPYGDSISAWYPVPSSELTLPYDQNNLSFSYIGIHHRNPKAVRYKWILEGFSKDWSPAIPEREAIFSNLPPGEYTFKVMACNEYAIWNELPAAYRFSILSPVWERWWARSAGLVITGFLIWFIFQQRVKRIKRENRAIQERLEMENSILQLEQEAARLQMNPHFIFNSLNSIQGFIATNDAYQAKRYLAKFARLMRLILENAREEFIPLKNEIDILENYLELEKLSANHKFDFTITLVETIDPESIEIPPMMLQPFVENAIVHGVKKRDSKGLISINFILADEQKIICEITDNGIGRKKSAALKGFNHKSTGIAVTTERLKQYGTHRNIKVGVEFRDLEEQSEPIGTQVIITMPVNQ